MAPTLTQERWLSDERWLRRDDSFSPRLTALFQRPTVLTYRPH